MKVNVEYDKYNTKMVKAEIPVTEDTFFLIELNRKYIEDEVDESDVIEKLVITSKDKLSDTEIQLSLSKSEVRELIMLLNNFRNVM